MRFKLQSLLKVALLLLLGTATSCINDNGVLNLRSKIKVSEKIVNISIPVEGDINGINASGEIKVEYVAGNENKINISGAENVVQAMEVTFDDDNILKLRLNDSDRYKFVSGRQRIKVSITSPSARHFKASAVATIRMDSISSDTTLFFKATSSGKIFIPEMKASSANFKSTSSGYIKIKQLISSSLDAKSNSSGRIEIDNATATSMILSASSTGRIYIDNVSAKEITADANSSGIIRLMGKAEKASLDASSAARISASKLKVNSGKISASSSAEIKSDVAEAFINESSSGKVKNATRK